MLDRVFISPSVGSVNPPAVYHRIFSQPVPNMLHDNTGLNCKFIETSEASLFKLHMLIHQMPHNRIPAIVPQS